MENTKKRRKISTKIILMFLILLVIIMAAIGFVTYRISYNTVLDNYNSIVASAGQLAAASIDTSLIDGWIKNGTDKAYAQTNTLLSNIKSSYGLTYLYVSLPVFDDSGNMINDTIYVFDAMLSGEDPAMFGSLGEHSGAVDVYEQCKYLYENNVTIKSDLITQSEFGWLLSAYVPLCGEDGNPIGWIGVDIEMGELVDSITSQTLITVSLIFALITLFALIFMIYVRKSVVNPVNTLSKHMNRFVSSTDELEFSPIDSIKTNDEIEQMSADFNSMARSIIEYTDNLAKSTAEKERMRADLDVSFKIRASLSGDLSYPAFPERSDFAVYSSMKNTIFNKSSFCDCFFTDENDLFLVVGESAGRSLAAMLCAMLAATNIRCFAKMGYQPYRIAVETNNQLISLTKSNPELTVEAMIVQINLRTGLMRYVNAGMPHVLVKDTGIEFDYDSKPIGFNLGQMPNVSFTQETLRLSQGNMLLLMSHGVPEMKNENGFEYTETYVQNELNAIASREYDLKSMIDQLESALEDFRGEAELESDTSMILFRYFG